MKKITLVFEPEHFNHVCNYTIPAAWTAFIPGQPKWPCGETKEEALANIKREYPDAKVKIEE